MKKINLNITGMHCKSCGMLIKSELEDIGVKAEINNDGKAKMEFDEKNISEKEIEGVIKKLGYGIQR